MPPADEAVQQALRQRLETLAYPWPEHDGSALPTGVWEGEDGMKLIIEPDRVWLSMGAEKTLLFHAGRVEEGGGVATCCGMQTGDRSPAGELRLLARMLRAPFTVDVTCRFNRERIDRSPVGDRSPVCEATLRGVGQQERTFVLRRV